MILTTENKLDISSVKSLGLEISPLGKSFLHTKKKNGPKIDTLETPGLMEDQLEDL